MTSDFSTKITKVKTALEAIFVKKADRSHISYGQVDSTSTSTAFTATVTGLTSLTDGATVMLRNGYITSAEGFTLNVNGLGAKPVYNSMADATRDTTIFNINYTMLFVYDSTRVENGCWICYRGYNSDKDTNTIGYQIRTNSSTYTATDKFVRYRLLLEVDDEHYMPVNTSTSTSATAAKNSAINTREFKIGGRIMYYGTTATVNANTQIAGVTYLWTQINLVLGYSFSDSSAGPSLTTGSPVYLVAKPSTTNKGMAKLNTPYYTQSLPSTADGLIYIYLGQATDATHLELVLDHPIYEYYGSDIRLYREYYDSSEVDTLLSGKSDTGHTHNYSTFSGDYEDLTNKPTIPLATSDLTNDGNGEEPFLTHSDISAVGITNSYEDLDDKPTIPSAYTHPSSHPASMITGLATVATSGKASDLNNDSGFLTSHNPIDSSLSSSSENAVQNKVINTALENKVDKVSGKGLSTNDFNATYKGYVDNLVSSSNTTKNAHVHGSIGSGGTLNSDITSVNKIAVTDSSNNLKTISYLPYNKLSGTPDIPQSLGDLELEEGTSVNVSNGNILADYDSINNSVSLLDGMLYYDISNQSIMYNGTDVIATLSDIPTVPTASTTTPSADTTNGSYGSGTSYARSNHSHPKSNLYVTSIALVPKSSDATGAITLYYGDEPS